MEMYRECEYTENVNTQRMWPTKVKFDWPFAKIGPKMASGQLLFCALFMFITYTSYDFECILSGHELFEWNDGVTFAKNGSDV